MSTTLKLLIKLLLLICEHIAELFNDPPEKTPAGTAPTTPPAKQ